jgi:putative Mg2+ transporter-C (MgtC) family protein
MEPLTDTDALVRLAVAMAAGAVLGYERERADKPAGIRTYMLVTQGAALFMVCAILLAQQVWSRGELSDPGRIASTVVQGIGFIAAGVILTTGREVIGLTTAAGLWVATAIGLLIGAGFFVIALVATAATVVALIVLKHFEHRVLDPKPRPPKDSSAAGASGEATPQ